MILGPISLVDCVIFVSCLIPNLLVLVGPLQTLSMVKFIPFLGILLLPSMTWFAHFTVHVKRQVILS